MIGILANGTATGRSTVYFRITNRALSGSNNGGARMPPAGGEHYYNVTLVDLDTLSGGEWVVTYNDGTGNGHIEILSYNGNSWDSLDLIRDTSFNQPITCLGVQGDGDILVGDSGGFVRRFDAATLTQQDSVAIGDPIADLTVVLPSSPPPPPMGTVVVVE